MSRNAAKIAVCFFVVFSLVAAAWNIFTGVRRGFSLPMEYVVSQVLFTAAHLAQIAAIVGIYFLATRRE